MLRTIFLFALLFLLTPIAKGGNEEVASVFIPNELRDLFVLEVVMPLPEKKEAYEAVKNFRGLIAKAF